MLLAVSHDNAQFIRLPLDGVFLSVHGAEVEHSGSRCVAFERLGHPLQNLERTVPVAMEVRRSAGTVGQFGHLGGGRTKRWGLCVIGDRGYSPTTQTEDSVSIKGAAISVVCLAALASGCGGGYSYLED